MRRRIVRVSRELVPFGALLCLAAACGRAADARSAAAGAASRPAPDGAGGGAPNGSLGTGGAVRWAEPSTLSTDGGAAVAFAARPDGGGLTEAWVAAPARGVAAHLVVRPDAGAAGTLADPDGGMTVYGETPPKLAYAPDGTLYAAYLITRAVPGHKWPVNALRLAASRDGGAHWDAPRTVRADTSDNGSTDDHALHVAPDGTLYLTWLALTGETSHAYVARSADRGATWSAPTPIDRGPSCPCCRTAVASGPDGALYAAWRKIFPVEADGRGRAAAGGEQARDVVVARSADGGRTWGAPVRVRADDWRVSYCPDAGPSVKVGPDGAVHVAWWTGKEGEAGVRYARSTDGGRSFGEAVPLGVARHSRAAHVQLAVQGAGDSARVVAAWDDGTRAVPAVVTRASRDGGRSFDSTVVLSAAGVQASYPVVAFAGRDVRVAWQQRTTAGAAQDSARQAAVEHQHAAPSAAQYIQPVGAWEVVSRAGTLAPGAR